MTKDLTVTTATTMIVAVGVPHLETAVPLQKMVHELATPQRRKGGAGGLGPAGLPQQRHDLMQTLQIDNSLLCPLPAQVSRHPVSPKKGKKRNMRACATKGYARDRTRLCEQADNKGCDEQLSMAW